MAEGMPHVGRGMRRSRRRSSTMHECKRKDAKTVILSVRSAHTPTPAVPIVELDEVACPFFVVCSLLCATT